MKALLLLLLLASLSIDHGGAMNLKQAKAGCSKASCSANGQQAAANAAVPNGNGQPFTMPQPGHSFLAPTISSIAHAVVVVQPSPRHLRSAGPVPDRRGDLQSSVRPVNRQLIMPPQPNPPLQNQNWPVAIYVPPIHVRPPQQPQRLILMVPNALLPPVMQPAQQVPLAAGQDGGGDQHVVVPPAADPQDANRPQLGPENQPADEANAEGEDVRDGGAEGTQSDMSIVSNGDEILVDDIMGDADGGVQIGQRARDREARYGRRNRAIQQRGLGGQPNANEEYAARGEPPRMSTEEIWRRLRTLIQRAGQSTALNFRGSFRFFIREMFIQIQMRTRPTYQYPAVTYTRQYTVQGQIFFAYGLNEGEAGSIRDNLRALRLAHYSRAYDANGVPVVSVTATSTETADQILREGGVHWNGFLIRLTSPPMYAELPAMTSERNPYRNFEFILQFSSNSVIGFFVDIIHLFGVTYQVDDVFARIAVQFGDAARTVTAAILLHGMVIEGCQAGVVPK